MDLHLFARVLLRFKYLVAGGFVVAMLLSMLTIVKLDPFHGFLAPRTAPIYQASANLFVTEPGFPWGSAVQTYTPAGKGASSPTGDLGRLTSLANLYAQLANSDEIKAIAAHRSPREGKITATEMYYTSPGFYTSALPIVTIAGAALTPSGAIATAQAGANALMGYLRQQQRAAGIPKAHRVVLQEILRPRKTTVLNPTKKTLPVVVFLTVMLAVLGLAFVLENLRTVPEAVALRPEADALPDDTRRSA